MAKQRNIFIGALYVAVLISFIALTYKSITAIKIGIVFSGLMGLGFMTAAVSGIYKQRKKEQKKFSLRAKLFFLLAYSTIITGVCFLMWYFGLKEVLGNRI